VLSSLVVRERRPVELIIMKSSEETKVGGVIHKTKLGGGMPGGAVPAAISRKVVCVG
jgi:hypothetical protein